MSFSEGGANDGLHLVRKRDGREVPFDAGKIVSAVQRAMAACGDPDGEEDAGIDDGVGDTGDGDAPADPDVSEEDVPGDGDVDTDAGDPDGLDAEGETAAVCGNGVLEEGEVCDDGDTETEDCDVTDPGACLADCSLRIAACGNGTTDPGEQCDDGDDDSTDGCSTSCTTVDGLVGSPCRCTTGCEVLDYTAGTIEGCDALASLEDATRTVACMYSAYDDSMGIEVHAAEGACTLMAVGCEGAMCDFAPVTGDVDAFTCPEGYVVMVDVTEVLGMVVTTKACHLGCTSDADCRWNAVEGPESPWSGECGRLRCLPLGEGGESMCWDERSGT